jgi:hypothetical protein
MKRKYVQDTSIYFMILFLTSCHDKATFKFPNGETITFKQKNLSIYSVGQNAWLIGTYTPSGSDSWKMLEGSDIDQIGFVPKNDTSFIFRSQEGYSRKNICLAQLIKKHRFFINHVWE